MDSSIELDHDDRGVGGKDGDDDDVEWLVSEVHMVHEIPAAATGEDASAAGGDLHLSRFPLYDDVADDEDGTDELQAEEEGEACVDDEGDLVVPRRGARCAARRQPTAAAVLTLMHTLRSTLPAVGLQVWRGSLVLAEYIMREQDAGRWHGVHALELGAGVGLAGLIMARHASRVWFTDYDEEVLSICEKNTRLNRHLFAHDDVTRVRKLNWLAPPSFAASAAEGSTSRAHTGGDETLSGYEWTPEDAEDYRHVTVLLAADVIYEDHLTTALFSVLEEMLRGDRVLVLSIEKRINFTLEDLAPTSKAYDHFRSFFVDVDADPATAPSRSSSQPRLRFEGRRIPVIGNVPQRFDYDRVAELELWTLRSRTDTSSSSSFHCGSK